ncbi:hypothetical protein JCM10599A_23060 [Paraburkholderia kururiensis]
MQRGRLQVFAVIAGEAQARVGDVEEAQFAVHLGEEVHGAGSLFERIGRRGERGYVPCPRRGAVALVAAVVIALAVSGALVARGMAGLPGTAQLIGWVRGVAVGPPNERTQALDDRAQYVLAWRGVPVRFHVWSATLFPARPGLRARDVLRGGAGAYPRHVLTPPIRAGYRPASINL